ncbi:hypothetical protein PInf_004652 [Phytophthora infestans]|nr:hypothetical protein PInf_004652 [Phytophthora infestans]
MPNKTNIPAISREMHRAEICPEFGVALVAVSTPAIVSTAPLSTPAVRRVRDDPTERLIYYQHKLHIPAEIPVIHETLLSIPRKQARATRPQRQWSPSHTHPVHYERHDEEIDPSSRKRRRLMTSPTPTFPSRKPLYESDLESVVQEGDGLVSRRCYARTDSNHFQKAKLSSPMDYSESERRFRTNDVTEASTPRVQTIVEKCESTSLATLVLKSKEFLQSKNLVRNRHDEIDWVATFLNVGFDSSSIYALMCPLRRGRWKSEEENYTMGLLRLIENGTILLRHGQSIRGFIGEKLHSDDASAQEIE